MANQGAVVGLDCPEIDAEEWRVRVELAAIYRLLHHYGWDELIYNHAAARVPGEPDKFLIKKHDMLYNEVRASNLVKLGMGGQLDERHGVNKPGFMLHSGIFLARPDVHCTIHIHSAAAAAVSALPSGLRMVSQAALRFYGRVGYHDLEGIADSLDERGRIIQNLGDNRVLFLRYHGVVSVGVHCTQAINTLRHLMTACTIQMMVEASSQITPDIPEPICAETAIQVAAGEKRRGNDEMPAYMRLLDSIDRSYRS